MARLTELVNAEVCDASAAFVDRPLEQGSPAQGYRMSLPA